MEKGHIKNWPADERPREKLLLKGPETLSNAELLAIFLRVGVKGKTAIDLARELLQRFGSLRELYSAPRQDLENILGLGPAKIAQFKAVLELSRRFLAEGLPERPYVESVDDVLKLLQHEMRDLDQEVFKAIFLNGKNHIIAIVEITKGTLTSANVYPREVVKMALRHSAAAVVFAHNHPSGTVRPSEEDQKITKELVLACQHVGVRVHDHLIIRDGQHFSFADDGLIDKYNSEFERRKSL